MVSRFVRVAGLSQVLGMFDSLIGQNPSKKWVVGTSVEYGLYLELGTRNHPPYSWLGPATNAVRNRGNIIADRSNNTEELVANIALAIEAEAVRRLSGRDVRPFPQSGNLMGSIEARPR